MAVSALQTNCVNALTFDESAEREAITAAKAMRTLLRDNTQTHHRIGENDAGSG